MKDTTLKIEGMTCHHCVMAVRKALSQLPEVRVHDVAIGSASLAYDETKITPAQLAAAIEAAGYKAIS